MSPAAWAAVSSITVAVIVGAFGVLQLVLKRQQPADDEAGPTKSEAYKLAGDLTPAVIQLSMRVTELEQIGRQVPELRDAVAKLRATVAVVIPAARVLVAWIDAGAHPPPPVITDDLRQMLSDQP